MRLISASLKTVAALGLVATAATSHAATVILDFNPSVACGVTGCDNETKISATYGSTAELAVDFAPSSVNLAAYWDSGYGTLSGVAFQNNVQAGNLGGASSDPLTISFTAAAGYAITGFGFDFATYGAAITSSVYTVTGDGTVISSGSLGPAQINGITVGAFSPANNVTFKFGPDNWNAGVDNITIQVSAIPEPGEWAMMLAGLGVVSAIARKRRKAATA